MEFVKLRTNYYRDEALMRAGEAAEVLFTRALAHCGDHETNGVVTTEVLPFLTPTRGRARAAALVREELWEVIPVGWRFRSWDKHQVSRDQLEATRASGRDRQARHRSRNGVGDGVRNAVTNGRVTGTEVEVETGVPPVSPSRSAVRAIDGLTDQQLEQIRRRLGCTESHAAGVVIEVLARSQTTVLNPFRYVMSAIEQETDRYRPTPGPPTKGDCCPMPGHGSYPAGHCGACRSEAIAGGDR